jgi:Flp pilus assembly protein TadG
VRTQQAEHGDAGGVAVEFALVVPLLLVILFGIVEFGFVFNTQIALTQAAREGVRREALGFDDAEATAQAAVLGSALRGGATASLTQVCPDDPTGTDEARMLVTLDYEPLTALPISPALRGEAVMRCGG